MIRQAFRDGGWRLALSTLVPVRFRSTHRASHYCEAIDDYHDLGRQRSTWWQFRGRVALHRIAVLAVLMLTLVVAFVLILASAALAADGHSVADETAVVIGVGWLTLIVAPFLPYVTAWLTTNTLRGALKVLVTAAGAFVLAILTSAIDGGTNLIVSWGTVIQGFVAVGVAMVGYVVQRPLVDKAAAQTRGVIGPPPTR